MNATTILKADFLIIKFKFMPSGYSKYNQSGWKQTQTAKDKLSEANSGENNPMFGRTDENSPSWKGDKAGKNPIHRWVVKRLGKASNYKCIDCDKQAYDWSNVDHTWKRDLDDYAPRCRSCHKKYDYKFNNNTVQILTSVKDTI